MSKSVTNKEMLELHPQVQVLLGSVIMLMVSTLPTSSCYDVLQPGGMVLLHPVLLVVVVASQVEVHIIVLQDRKDLPPDSVRAGVVSSRVDREVAEDNLPAIRVSRL